MTVPKAKLDQLTSAPFDAGRDETLYQSERTRVFRRLLTEGGSLVCKEPLGSNALERLRHERKMLKRLSGIADIPQLAEGSPNVIALLEDGHRVTLAEVIRVKRLDVHALVALALPLAHIIAAVHRAGVIHKDINPANILLDSVDSRPILIDYDLATSFSEERPSFIPTDEIAGTLAYLAPEQTGRTGRSVDQRADLYALGATLYELAVGHPPFTSDDPLQLIHDHLAHVPVPPVQLEAAIPPGLSDIILRLLEKEPDQRYQSAEGLAHDLMRLNDMQRKGGRGTFPLGERDFPLRLMPPSRLVGREREITALQTVFDHALNGVGCVFVAGAPGVGKSALINELRPMVAKRGGWFVAGKFDQYRSDAASGAVMQVFIVLARLLLAEPEAVLMQQRGRMLDALGPNAGLVAALIPEFAILFGVEPDIATGDLLETEVRLRQAAVDLLRAVASPSRPLVIFLDDLQWIVPVALKFVDALVTAENLRGLLLVGAYREIEVDAAHPLSAMLQRWQRLSTSPVQLRLDNLPQSELTMLLAEMLRLPPTGAASLADAVGARTGGNPYDTIELVNALRRDGALVLGDDGWGWDAASIRRFVGQGEVVDILAARIARLPGETQGLLEIMACLGGEVKLGLLQAASGLSETALEEQIAPSLEDGLLVMEHSDHMNAASALRFRHDRVQQATYGRLDPARRQTPHLTVARRLAVLPEFQAQAAEVYLPAIDEVRDPDERRRVAALFHAAAGNAQFITDYATAERFLTAALALLNTMQAAADDPLSAALEIELHAALYSLGRLDEADAVYGSIEGRQRDPVTLAGPACVQVDSLTNRGRHGEAMALGLDLLRRLGLPTPEEHLHAEIERRLDALYQWAEQDARVDERQRREADGPQVLAAAKLFNRLVPAAFFSEQTNLAWLLLETQRLWVGNGCCASMMAPLALTSFITIGMRQDYRTGYSTVRHILTVSEARGYVLENSQARHLFAIGNEHWFEPLEDAISHAQRAREGLVHGGDLLYACFTYCTSIAALLDCAPTLERCTVEIDAALAFAARTGNDQANANFLAYRQLLRVLRGETDAPGSFNDTSFDETAHLAGLAANLMAAGYYHINRALAAAVFDDGDALVRHAAAAMPLLPYIPGFYPTVLAHLLQALALARRITTELENHAALLAEFDACRDWLVARTADAPGNFLHLLKWVEAERAWAVDDFQGAAWAFDAALIEVDERRRPWHQALMSERAGLFHLARGLERTGRQLLADAWQGYQAWGASAKVQDMARRYGFLRTALRRKNDRLHGSSTGVSADSIDLVGILRASQALSSETSFVRLRVRMSELLRELTGATDLCGAIWYDDLQEWCLPPPRNQGESSEPIPVEEGGQRGLLPLSVFNYVVRTREPLLVDDALRDDRFARDPYFAAIESCSLLGVPVFNKGVLRLVLLLENRLGHGAFTAERLDAVMLIAGQLAISVDNALLYDSLERKVAERTEALGEANLRLEALSITDPLTGLANRRRFSDMIEAEWQRAIRPRIPIAVAMIDIDQFKLYNDHYGHQGGDECLRRVARVLGDSIRGGIDLVARYGGEEFVIVLPGANLDAIHPVAERARAAVEALKEPHAQSGLGIVTISVGIAAMIPTAHSDAEALIELADAALYRAKKNGRNQVVGRKTD